MEFDILILLLIAAAAITLYALGPRVSLDTSVHPLQLPDNLDAYLENSEAKFDDVTDGAEKTIVWADSTRKQQTELAFVYLHGFSATRQESTPVSEDVARHFDSNIYFARLAGNGRSDDALSQGSVNKWVNDVAEAMAISARLGRKTVLIGCSTGATLAWWAAHQPQFAKQIAALVFLSPNFGVADERAKALLYPWGAQLARWVAGPYRESDTISEAHAKFWTNRYPIEALLPMMGMVKLANRYKPSTNNPPIHITYSKYDDTVSVKQIQSFCSLLTTPHEVLQIVQPAGSSQHVIVGDILAPENNAAVTQSVILFLEKHLLPA